MRYPLSIVWAVTDRSVNLMPQPLDIPDLGLTAEEADARFAALQAKLVPLWRSIERFSSEEQTIVVVPSLSVDVSLSGPILQAYEERFLFLLLLLRQPSARLIYVTSMPIQQTVVDYYLNMLPGVIASQARQRLKLLSPHDGSAHPLSRKLLARPRLLKQIRDLIPDPDRAHLIPFNTTRLERDLALRLGVPMYAADPRFFPLGTKSGCRRIFAEEAVPHPLGVENLSSAADLVAAIRSMRTAKPSLSKVIVKLNEGVSGEGNAALSLEGLPPAGDPAEASAIEARLTALRFELESTTAEFYLAKLEEHGGIVEELIQGRDFRSPSAQLRITPLGEVEQLSTHDQLLGGPGGQSYLGCRFPADEAYAPLIMQEALKVGRRLAREGVLGRFAIDFVVVKNDDDEWEAYAIEINLRKGGTTHPFLTLQFLTDGTYDPRTGVFTTALGRQKFFVASDYVASPAYRVFTPDDLFDIVARHGLHFDQARQKGVVLHMLTALGIAGRFGLTAVGDSHDEANALYRKAIEVMDAEADRAMNVA